MAFVLRGGLLAGEKICFQCPPAATPRARRPLLYLFRDSFLALENSRLPRANWVRAASFEEAYYTNFLNYVPERLSFLGP